MMGQTEKALDVLAEALAITEETGEFCLVAELCRLYGELLIIRAEDPKQVEHYLHQARDVARNQQAKSLELRERLA